MCIHCLQKEMRKTESAIDFMISDKMEVLMAQSSCAKAWTSAPPRITYFDYQQLEKRVLQNQRKIKRVYMQWLKRFNENYRNVTGANIFEFIQRFKKADISLDVWESQVIAGVTDPAEMETVLLDIVNNELEIVMKQVEETLFTVNGVVIEGANEPPQAVIDFLEDYELRLSQSTAVQVDQRLKNIIINGVADGKSTANIAKDIRKTFNTLSKSKSQIIARTETIRGSGQAQKGAYSNAGIAKVAVMPAVTACPICMSVAWNNPYDVNDNAAYPPFHPNCRCSVVPVLRGSNIVDDINVEVVEPSPNSPENQS